jgi:hypothetical protein
MTRPATSLIPADRYEELPFPIATCCEHFNTFVARNEVVAAWLQARDVYEVLTKFYVAALASEEFVLGDDNPSPVRAALVTRLLAKSPSFGDWVHVLRDAAKPGCGLPNLSPRIVSSLLSRVVFVESRKINPREGPAMKILREAVTWRNDEIGHGALGRKSELLREVVAAQAGRLAELLDHMRILSTLRLAARFVDGTEVELTGTALPPALGSYQYSTRPRDLQLHLCRSDANRICLHPLVLLEFERSTLPPSVLVFDKRVVSRNGRPKADVYLDYQAGRKLVIAPPLGLVDPLGETGMALNDKECLLPEVLSNSRTSYSASLYEQLHRLRFGLDNEWQFVAPSDPIERIVAWLEEVPRGYLHVTGPAGVGKSWLAGSLQRADIIGEDYASSVLTFHVGFGAAQSQAAFVSELNAQALRTLDRMQAVLAEEHTPSAARDRLSCFLTLLAGSSPNQEVILVIDGLDEVVDVADDKISILDFLPNVEAITEGVKIILLSRAVDDLCETGRRNLQRLKQSAASVPNSWTHFAIEPTSASHRQLINELIRNRLPGEPSELLKRIEEKSVGIPLRATHLCALVKMSDENPLEHVGCSLADLYASYLRRLEDRVGTTWFKRLYRPLLSVLAIAREPLELEGLAEILDVSAEHIYLASLDLADCFRSRRYSGEATMFLELSHAELRQFVRDETELWEEGHAKASRCFLNWWRNQWLAQPESRLEKYAERCLPLHLVGARDAKGIEEVLYETLVRDPPRGLRYLTTILDGLHGYERLTNTNIVKDRLELLDSVLGRVHQNLRSKNVLKNGVSEKLYGLRVQVRASLADRHAHTAPTKSLKLLARAIELADAAVAELGSTDRRPIDTERAILLYKLHENLRSTGRPEEAEQALNRSLQLRELLAASAQSVHDRRVHLCAAIWCHLGMSAFKDTSGAKADCLGRALTALQEVEQIGAETPEEAAQVVRLQGVISASLAATRPQDRITLLERAIAAYCRARASSPEDRYLEYSLGSTQRSLACALLARDEPDCALAHILAAEEIVADLLDYEPENAFYIRLDAGLRCLRSRLKGIEGDTAHAIERMRDACQRMEVAGAVLKDAVVQREVEEFRQELKAMEQQYGCEREG